MSDIVKRLRSEQNPGLAVRQQAADALERLAAENAALLCEARDTPPALTCEHPASLLLRSAETGEPLYCELCDDKSGRRDAVQCEAELRAEVDRLKTALKTVGDDYPGSSCQQWCYEAAGIRAPALQPCGHPWKAQHDFKCILCSSPGPAHEECLGCSSPTTCEKYGCSVKRQRAIDSASGDRDATSAQSAEEQRFLHGAANGIGPDPLLQEIAMRALASGPTITLTLDEVRALYKFLHGTAGTGQSQ